MSFVVVGTVFSRDKEVLHHLGTTRPVLPVYLERYTVEVEVEGVHHVYHSSGEKLEFHF